MTIDTAAARLSSEHVLYEIEMFCAIAKYFETGAVDHAVQGLEHQGLVVRNALIEAFQLHARQLIDLLTSKDSRDMSASDFTTSTWRRLDRSGRRLDDFDRFSKRVMHLSLKRAEFTEAEQLVDSRRIRRDLGGDIRRFLDAVDENKVTDEFLRRARLALRLSEPPTDQTDTVVAATQTAGACTRGTATAGFPGDV